MNVLKRLTDLSHNMAQATANARMGLKLGDPITPEECVDLDTEVITFMRSDINANRFMEIDDSDVSPLREGSIRTHEVTVAAARIHAYALDVKQVCQFSA